MKIKLLYCLLLIFSLSSCYKRKEIGNDEGKIEVKLINTKNSKDAFIVTVDKTKEKMTIKDLSGNMELYFLKKNGEFYASDEHFIRDIIGKDVWLSTKSYYNVYDGNDSKGYHFTIQKENQNFVTKFKSWHDNTSYKIDYYYDGDYRVNEIVINDYMYYKAMK